LLFVYHVVLLSAVYYLLAVSVDNLHVVFLNQTYGTAFVQLLTNLFNYLSTLHNSWSLMAGVAFARWLYLLLSCYYFTTRDHSVVADDDNIWLFDSLRKFEFLSQWFDFLKRYSWFTGLNVYDGYLLKKALYKSIFYTFPLIINLLFIRWFNLDCFIIGLFLMLFWQFFKQMLVLTCACIYGTFQLLSLYFAVNYYNKNYYNNFLQFFEV